MTLMTLSYDETDETDEIMTEIGLITLMMSSYETNNTADIDDGL